MRTEKHSTPEHYHADLSDGGEARWDIVRWGQNWRVWKHTFVPPAAKTVEDAGIYSSKREARAEAVRMSQATAAATLRHQVFSEMDRFDEDRQYDTKAGWTAEEIADDLPYPDRSPALAGRDPAELLPFVEEWLQQRRKA